MSMHLAVEVGLRTVVARGDSTHPEEEGHNRAVVVVDRSLVGAELRKTEEEGHHREHRAGSNLRERERERERI